MTRGASAPVSCPALLREFDLTVGFDSEFVRGTHYPVIPAADNAVVSLQADIRSPRTGRRVTMFTPLKGPTKRFRLSLGGYLTRVVVIAEEGGLFDTPTGSAPKRVQIALAVHFSRADLCAFTDFATFKRKLDGVRKTFVSAQRPMRSGGRARDGRALEFVVTVFDTKLLAPDGYGRLAKLGEALGIAKLEPPDVIDELAATVPGITRMDLVLRDRPAEFKNYAMRDSEIAVEWLWRMAVLAAGWGLRKMPVTLARIAQEGAIAIGGTALADVLGRVVTRRGRIGKPSPSALSIQTLCADAFYGGRNEAYGHGFFNAPIDRPFLDFDLCGAYSTALAHMRPLDWDNIERTADISRLASLDRGLTCATVEFEFPPDTKFPCLPVDTGDHGLIFPIAGVGTFIGPELLLALNMGARLKVLEGVLVPWIDPDGLRPFVDFTARVNAERARFTKKSAEELATKTIGNSCYGKLGMGVAGLKSTPRIVKQFDPRSGSMEQLKPGPITSPLIAAYTSGLPRAVLSEIIASLPGYVRLLSATTDGFLCDATIEEAKAAATGPISRLFSDLRVLVDPKRSPDILEVKHRVLGVALSKTRGCFTTKMLSGAGPKDEPILARAGHRFEFPPEGPMAESLSWVDLFRARTFQTKLRGLVFISIRDQWKRSADLSDRYPLSRVSLDFDMKRRPVAPTDDTAGYINFMTEPWGDAAEFGAWVKSFDRWRMSTQSVLKSLDDWCRFLAFRTAPRTRTAASWSPFVQALVIAASKGLPGLPIRPPGRRGRGVTYTDLAANLRAAGVAGLTERILRHAAKRGSDPAPPNPSELLDSDLRIIHKIWQIWPPETTSQLPIHNGTETSRIIFNLIRPTPITKTTCVETPSNSGSYYNQDRTEPNSPKLGRGVMSLGELDLTSEPIPTSRITTVSRSDLTAVETAPDGPLEPPASPAGAAVELLPLAPVDVPLDGPASPRPAVERSPIIGLPPSLLSLDDRRHGVRIVAALRREFGIGGATLLLGRKAAAKVGLTERERFLLGLAHAVVIKTGKTLACAWAVLDRIANEVA
jgi:hypothetical protein